MKTSGGPSEDFPDGWAAVTPRILFLFLAVNTPSSGQESVGFSVLNSFHAESGGDLEKSFYLAVNQAKARLSASGGITDETEEVFREAEAFSTTVPRNKGIEIRHLIAVVVKYVAAGRIDIPEVKPGPLAKTLLEALAADGKKDVIDAFHDYLAHLLAGDMSMTGGSILIRREAQPSEYCLNVRQYAEILATFIHDAEDGEFCFALFGHWGRGKTFLINRTEEVLRDPDGEVELKYEFVRFSAWRYPNRPEVWVHLYQAFSKVAFAETVDRLTRFRRAFFIGLQKAGIWPLILALISLAAWLMPGSDPSSWGSLIIAGAGIGFLGSFLAKARGVVQSLHKQYLKRPDHTAKLGLQATIGEDLRRLLLSWLCREPKKDTQSEADAQVADEKSEADGDRPPKEAAQPDQQEELPAYPAGPLAVVFTALWAVFAWRLWGEISDPHFRVLVTIILPFFAWAGAVFSLPGVFSPAYETAPDRVLLVVDDLDRCDWEQLLAVIESIKVFLEHDDVHDRVQVVMLLEEWALQKALLNKYHYLLPAAASPKAPEPGTKRFTEGRVFRENSEKFFTTYLRLPELNSDEFEQVAKTFLHSQLTHQEQRLRERLPERTETSQASASESAATHPQASPPDQEKLSIIAAAREMIEESGAQPETVAEENPDFVFDKEEITAIMAKLNTLAKETRYWGPRAIRSFLFRYQLAREILKKLGHHVDPNALMEGLTARSIGKNFPRKKGLNQTVKKVVDQVV